MTDGAKYEGSYHEGKKQGKGLFIWKNGTTYDGDFHEDYIEGYGVLKLHTGFIYTGNWKKGLKHGEISLVAPDGTKRFEGNYLNDKEHGQFKYTNE